MKGKILSGWKKSGKRIYNDPLTILIIKSEPEHGRGRRVATFVDFYNGKEGHFYIERDWISFSWLKKAISIIEDKIGSVWRLESLGLNYKEKIQIKKKRGKVAVINKKENVVYHSKPRSTTTGEFYFSKLTDWKEWKEKW